MKKLFTLLAVIAATSFYTVKADWVKNVQIAYYDFTLAPSPAFTTAASNLSGNTAAGITNVPLTGATGGYMYCAGSGSGGRGNKITNITATTARQDTVYYEFDWNPYKLLGQANSTGTSGTEPASYGVCNIRGANDSIIFGLWYERWSLKAGTNYNTSTGTEPLGDLHLLNISADTLNPMPARIVTRTVNATQTSYYTNTLLPYAMLDPGYTASTTFPSPSSYYAAKCDSINKSTDLGPTFKMSNWYHVKAVIDFMNKRIISFEITLTGTENKRTFTNLPFVNTGATDVSRLEIAGTRGKAEGGTGNGVNCDMQQQFDNIDIYTMHQVAAAANVTVRYKDATGTEIYTARVAQNQAVNSVYKAVAGDKINIIYGGDYYIYDATSVDSVTVATGGSEINLIFNKANPVKTVVTLAGPTTAELYHDVTMNFTVKTPNSDPVSQGAVNILVNGVVKNSIVPDVLGMGSVTFPNLLVGTENIKAVYVGDRIAYTSSDTVGVAVEITPSLANEIPYPVYYDLGTMPEIFKYRMKYTSAATPRASINFAADSVSNFSLSTDLPETTIKTKYATWGAYGFTTPGKTADYYGASDAFNVPYGNGTNPTWMLFKTPWLNKGAYNIYMNQRTNLDGGMKTTVTMDGKTLYYPNAELNGFSIRGGNNNKRRWNANTNDGLNQMSYLGSVVVDASGQHDLKLTCTSTGESSANQIAWLDMMEFIPVDQDSVNVNISAASGLAKTYFPLFNSGGYASNATASFITYASSNELSVPYQVVDPTVYTTNPYTLQHLGVTDPGLGLLGIDYVVIFKNDHWTRVSEGAVNTSDSTYTCNLADGNYYYQEYNYTENTLTPGSLGSRLWIKDGTFTVGTTAVKNVSSSNIKTYAVGRTLTVKGIKAGAKIMVTDLLGRVMLNAVSTSDVFTSTMKQGSVYIVKVISSNDSNTTKVIIK
ncbi:MAG: hypothetical protein PHR83_09265 [Paludibacter sp.]|nr:hypothetical protein [Paludibacter sp.]